MRNEVRLNQIRRRRIKRIKRIIATVGMGILLTAMLVLACAINYQRNEHAWNNGICHCGGIYYFKAVESASTSTSQTKYWYECDNCRDMMYQTYMR